ncbi:hypothetical protein FKP32DRAFT_1592353 [Trametes sanguinea]|nr:hypothetical protein FKP32DRAFT_1592353 [Trametes sanguinea]
MQSCTLARSSAPHCRRVALIYARHASSRRTVATQTSPETSQNAILLTTLKKIAQSSKFKPHPHYYDTPEGKEKLRRREKITTSIEPDLPPAVANAPPKEKPINLRKRTLQKLSALLTQRFGHGYQAEVFGSTLYAGSVESDMDVVILDEDRPHGFEPNDLERPPPIYSVAALARCFKDHGYQNVSTVPHASVPIVKLTDPETGLSCDVNVNSRLGLYNSWLIRHYCLKVPPQVSLLIRKVKTWVRSRNLNNPSRSGVTVSFSSYSLALMTIAYLQRLGALPNLQADPKLIFKTHYWEGRGSHARSIDVRYGICEGWQPAAPVPTIEQWLKFYGQEFDYKKDMISIRHGGIIRRPHSLPPDAEYSHFRGSIVVLDPFLPKNCTRSIQPDTLEEFREKCSVGTVLLMQRRELKEKKAKGRRLDDDEEDVEDP